MRKQWLAALMVVSAMTAVFACTSTADRTATSEPSATATGNGPTSTAAADGSTSTATSVPTPPSTPTVVSSPTAVATPSPVPTTSPAATSSPAPTPSQGTPTPGTPAAGTPMPGTPGEAFAHIASSVGFVETDITFGSGMLIEGGYVLTSARLVWPYNEANITFPDGSVFENVPVAARDLMVDIALLGPIETALEPLTLGSSGSLQAGAETVLIGYPGEAGQGPDPDFAEGVMSEVREWEEVGVTYLRTDHAIEGGHSGGALVSSTGEIVGMSSIGITETSLALAISSDDLQERVTSLLAGEDPSTLGDRQVSLTGGAQSHNFTLMNEWEEKLFAIVAEPEAEVTLTVDSQNNAALAVVDSFGGQVAAVNDTATGTETLTFTLDAAGSVYFVIASQVSVASGDFEISCDCDLAPINDPDEGQEVSAGTKTAGSLDIRGDSDMFQVALNEGDVIEVTLDSGNFDAIVFASWQGAGESELWFDDDNGGGLLGLNAQLVFRAPYTGTFIIYVRDVNDRSEGGYVLSVEQAAADDSRAQPAPPEVVDSEFGQMAVYQFTTLPFSVQYPADWTRAAANAGLGIVLNVNGPAGEVFSVAIDNLETLGQGDLTLQQYGDLVVDAQTSNGLTIDSRSTITTASGLTVERLEISAGDTLKAVRLAYVHEGNVGISVTVAVSPAAGFDDSEALFDYLLSTFAQAE